MDKRTHITVGGVKLRWDLEKGTVLFDEGDVVFFWTDAMKTFFDTIKQISGVEATNVVLETTGFRQGIIVGKAYKKMGVNNSNIKEWLSNTYIPAGWGKVNIAEFNLENDRIILHIQDGWEYKMYKSSNEEADIVFAPSHYAGVFTGLLGKSYWHKIVQVQSDVNPYSIIEYFPMEVNIQQNIRKLINKQEEEQIYKLEQLVEEKTSLLNELVRELSSPLIPVMDGIVVVPLIGFYDQIRAEELYENTLIRLPEYQAKFLLLDLTGLKDSISANLIHSIIKLGEASHLLGSEVILVGVSAQMAMEFVRNNIDLRNFECYDTLQHGIYYALSKSGKRLF